MSDRSRAAKRKELIRKTESITIGSIGKPRLCALLSELENRKVLVVGDVGVDRYTIGSVERISPEAPVPIVFVEQEQHKLGLAANVADNLRTLGGIPLLVGIVGKDRGAHDFKRLLKDAGISARHLIEDPSRRTVLKERIVSESQQLLRVDYESVNPISEPAERKCLKAIERLLPGVDAVIVEDYAKGMLNARSFDQVFKMVGKAGKIAACDPNMKTAAQSYRGAAVLTPNTREAEQLSGVSIRDEGSLIQAGETILEATRARHVVITRGKEGMAIFTAGKPGVQLIPTYAREVYDVSGAGDTVIAVLALALAAGATIVEAAVLGNVAAGIEVGKRGTATVTPEEILDFLNSLSG